MINIFVAIKWILGLRRVPSLSTSERTKDWLILPAWMHGSTEIKVPSYSSNCSIGKYERLMKEQSPSSVVTIQKIESIDKIYIVDIAYNTCTCPH